MAILSSKCNYTRGLMFWYIVSTLFLGIIGLIIYLFYMRKGQFEDPEDVKYQIFREEE